MKEKSILLVNAINNLLTYTATGHISGSVYILINIEIYSSYTVIVLTTLHICDAN
jgi:hypothetical protein